MLIRGNRLPYVAFLYRLLESTPWKSRWNLSSTALTTRIPASPSRRSDCARILVAKPALLCPSPVPAFRQRPSKPRRTGPTRKAALPGCRDVRQFRHRLTQGCKIGLLHLRIGNRLSETRPAKNHLEPPRVVAEYQLKSSQMH